MTVLKNYQYDEKFAYKQEEQKKNQLFCKGQIACLEIQHSRNLYSIQTFAQDMHT